MTVFFWIFAAMLAAVGIGFLAWPLLRAAPLARLDRRAATLAAHRARLAEIEAGEEGSTANGAASREARDDVARSLLRDLDAGARPGVEASDPLDARPRRGAAVLLGVAFALVATGLYVLIGEPRGLAPPTAPSGEEIGAAVGRLLAEAEALARANGNRLEGEPARLVERALVLAPTHRKALWFAAIAALHEDRAEDARTRLERIRGLGPLDEAESRMLEQLMNEAAARLPGL